MKIHAALGNGFQEMIYQSALKIYDRNEEVGDRRVDLFVEKTIMIELKAWSIFKMSIWRKQKLS